MTIGTAASKPPPIVRSAPLDAVEEELDAVLDPEPLAEVPEAADPVAVDAGVAVDTC